PLTGTVAMVVGGGSGIGRATAARLAAEGAAVVVADRDGKAAAEAVAGLPDAVGVAADVTDEASVAAMIAESALAFGGIDIVVQSAGLSKARADSAIIAATLAS